ncbi:gamma-aminobutyrate transaminase POP2 [Cucumis melo var. makuwa]|uniref:Gamma-aminobutyrate transaminase POP2 n=1 Tax=Cucumis melo var. makuwa TaxID=1194695 RepID=A0A5A7TIP0_CUCMM|nr:gamma-aminobutyrate transaminase POP2 [Cucumis melo var. makuwa]TYK19707.1 gamma-aminobutyrate transaminase POP2 [Cucumis melo var. makuwa]
MNHSDEPRTMSSFSSNFNETDVMFHEFVEDLNNPTGGSPLVDDNSDTSQPSPTPTPKRAQRNHRPTKLLDRSSLTIIATGQSRFCNDSTSLLSKEAVEDAHNQMLELQSQPTLDGS